MVSIQVLRHMLNFLSKFYLNKDGCRLKISTEIAAFSLKSIAEYELPNVIKHTADNNTNIL